MSFFIPEWDDRVDPDYDFSCDAITEGRDPYEHDVYAHEILSGPCSDGILISKSVIESNKTKKARIQRIGVHAHVRVPRSFPIMGDCGAFSYIDEEVPPYTPLDTLRFYEDLDFDYGVSVDHLIVSGMLKQTLYSHIAADGEITDISQQDFEAFKSSGLRVNPSTRQLGLFGNESYLVSQEVEDLTEAKRRWSITLENAKEFIQCHKKANGSIVPIGACQGWDPESQAEMVKEQQKMGYSYIALGGLVRSTTTEILEILHAVNKVRKPSTKIHLFGVARPEAIQDFLDAKVDSVDSARFLRQAWLSATSNFYAGDPKAYLKSLQAHRASPAAPKRFDNSPWRYTAIRVPPVFRENSTTLTPKVKKVMEKGAPLEEIQKLESAALSGLHSFAAGDKALESTLKAVMAYEVTLGGDTKNEALYRKTLENKPWEDPDSEICQQAGIDVLIFRRNNRNRRRGFHNTWWFFQFFRLLTDAN